MVTIFDNVHGFITLDDIASSIIDTDCFQRLRNINQTGTLYFVFPSARHSRFEHSIGTYYLANLLITNLQNKHPELNITEDIIKLVSIAGLCHDLGHLSYSHLFDDCFLPKLENYEELKKKTDNIYHENRSIFLLKNMIKKNNININDDQLLVISDLIHPQKSQYDNWNEKYKVGKWIFQIISNPVNSIDVDKFDYLVRDALAVGIKLIFNSSRLIQDAKIINDNIYYSKQCSEDIYIMFFIRYRLHRIFYNHKAVKSVEILIIKILFELEKEYKISEYILDYEKMIELVDGFIWFGHCKNNNIQNLIKKIKNRELPKLLYEKISLSDVDISEKINEFNNLNIKIIKFKVGYVNNNSNPLSKIKFYDKKKGIIIENSSLENFSLLINDSFQEYFARIYHII